MLLIAAALAVQLEAGAIDIKNPIDDQYVLYHADNLSSGTQMTSPVLGVALRYDTSSLVFTGGWRWMGHQYIDTDIITDHDYLNCRYKHGACPHRLERWHTRMSLREFYGSVGYKFHVGSYAVVPTFGLAFEELPTSIEIDYTDDYLITSHGHTTNWKGHAPAIYQGDKGYTAPFFGVDVEHGHWGGGIYYMQTAQLAHDMGDPGVGEHGILLRLTYRFGGAK